MSRRGTRPDIYTDAVGFGASVRVGRRGMANLCGVAGSLGMSLRTWLSWLHWEDCDGNVIEAVRKVRHVAKMGRLSLAIEIVANASDENFFCFCPRTEAQFRASWPWRDPEEMHDGARADIRWQSVADAALAGDGRLARRRLHRLSAVLFPEEEAQ